MSEGVRKGLMGRVVRVGSYGERRLAIAKCGQIAIGLYTLCLMLRQVLLLTVLLATSYFFFKMVQTDNKDDILINVGGKQVPLSLVNKPHHAVVGGVDKPVPNIESFPDVEPAAKEREAKLAEERAKKD